MKLRKSSLRNSVLLLAFIPLVAYCSRAGENYYAHTFFDNSLTADYYFYSAASAATPSTLERKDGKLPVETTLFVTPPNALRLTWESHPGGTWKAEVQLANFRNRFPGLQGKTLSFWLYAPEAIP